jgi:hypothetical protein
MLAVCAKALVIGVNVDAASRPPPNLRTDRRSNLVVIVSSSDDRSLV